MSTISYSKRWSRDNFDCHLAANKQEILQGLDSLIKENYDESFLECLEPGDTECREEDSDRDDGFLIDDENDDVICLN